MVIIDVRRFDALIFDLDGVITQTASMHARAWKQLFDEFLARRATETDGAFVPFDAENDYRRYVDGKPRIAGVESFLAARGITVPAGARRPGNRPRARRPQRLLFCGATETRRSTRVRFRRTPSPRGPQTRHAHRHRLIEPPLRGNSARRRSDSAVRCTGRRHRPRSTGFCWKASSDMFLEAARRLNAVPPRTAVFEDAVAGVEAARAGEFGLVIGVGSSARAPELLEHGADTVVADLGEVQFEGTVTTPRGV
jgi:trehalose 6-phosphate phosphatase